MQSLSTYSSLLTQNSIMINTTALTTKLSNELSTGRRAVDLADNPDRLTVLDLTQTKHDKEAYVKSCTLGQITTAQYTVSLQHIEKIAATALKSIQDLMTASNGLASPSNSTVPAEQNTLGQYSTLSNTLTQAMADMTISLNEQSSAGNGFLYSGQRNPSGVPVYSLPPVRDLNSLPYFAPLNATVNPPIPDPPAPIPHSNPAAQYPVNPLTHAGQVDLTVEPLTGIINPGLPTYDADFNPAAHLLSPGNTNAGEPLPSATAMAWGVNKLTIDSNQTVDLNVSSTAVAFQNMINGLRAAKTAADQAGSYSTVDRDAFMAQSFSYMTRALNGGIDPTTNTCVGGIRDLEQKNSLTELTIQTKSDLHTTDLNIINTRLDSLVGVDATTVTVQLATANNQLQAAYKVTASLLSMSLINYLK